MRNKLTNNFIIIFLLLQILTLLGCGGTSGSGSGNSTNNPSNTNPGSAPTVTMSQPINNATKVSLTQPVILAFSEAVTNVSTSTVKVYENSIAEGNVVPTANPTLGAGNTYTFNFPSNLNQNTTYYVVVGSGIKSVSSGKEVETTNFNFKTGTFANPTVSLVNPANESTNVPVNTLIQIQFSESVTNVNTATVTLYSESESGTPVAISSITPGGSDSYTLNLSGNLSYSTDYYVELSSGITSADEGVPLQATTFHFKTSAQPAAPTVLMISPIDNSLVKSLNPTIKIQFSESVTGVSSTNFQLLKGDTNGQAVPAQSIIAESNNVYEFIPASSLEPSTKYFVSIGNGITSTVTGYAVESTNFSFAITFVSLAYVSYQSGVALCAINSTGTIDTCTPSKATLTNAYNVSIDPSHLFAYVARRGSAIISSCAINPITGDLVDCKSGSYATPTSITFNSTGSLAYITNSNTNVSICSITSAGSLPTGCKATGGIFNSPKSLALNSTNTYAYVTNSSSTSQSISLCSVESTGLLSNCSITATGFTNPIAIILNNSNSYSYTTSGKSVRTCAVNSQTGNLSACNNTAINNASKLSSITLNGNKIYLTDGDTSTITVCNQDESSGTISNCIPAYNNAQGSLTSPTGITILSNGNF